MKLTCVRDEMKKQTVYALNISEAEFVRAYYDSFDRLLIDECEISDKVSDKLLALEVVARRIESG